MSGLEILLVIAIWFVMMLPLLNLYDLRELKDTNKHLASISYELKLIREKLEKQRRG